MSDELTLPRGWARKSLGDVLHIVRGVTYEKSDSAKELGKGLVPILRATNIGAGLDFDDLVYVPSKCVSEEQMLRCGDIVIAASSGSLSVVGKAARLTVDWPGSFGAFCMGLRVEAPIESAYVAYFLGTAEYRRGVSQLAAGSNINNLRRTHIESFSFPLAPEPEQRRIVAKIEELFSDLDAGVAALLRVRANLKRYRAAVLKAAVEGRLTQEWRTRNPATEPAAKLLERILVGRRAKWEQDQLRKFKEAGKTPPKGWKEKYVNPHTPEVEALHELPRSWAWATLDMIADNCGGITKGQKHSASKQLREVPYLRVANVQRGYLDLSEIKTIPATERDLEDLRLMPGDILFNEGGDRDKLGRGWVWNGEIPNCIHQNHVFRARLFLKDVQPKFVSYHGNSFGQLWFLRTGKQSVNLASINLTVLRKFPVPLPPAAEQVEIVAEVDRRLSVADAAEMQVAHALQRAARLRQSILKRAFEGRLVDQDPSDEPAAVLLRRIEAGGESSGKRGVQSRAAYPLLSRRRKGSLPTP